MLRIATPDEFVASPVGRYCAGEQFLVWARTPTCAGTIAWGRISARAASALCAVWTFERKLASPYAAIIDASGLEAVEPDAFETVLGYMHTAAPLLATRVARQALIRPPGMAGALVAGFYPTLSPGFVWRDFATADEAYEWCLPDEPTCQAELEPLVAEARVSAGLLPQVTAALRTRLQHPPTLQALADELRVSSRSLQRALHHAGTSVRHELTRVRIEHAARRLRETDDKIEAIANQTGFQSLSAFASAFRKGFGVSPSAYRARRP